jgi:hypothetical protein
MRHPIHVDVISVVRVNLECYGYIIYIYVVFVKSILTHATVRVLI